MFERTGGERPGGRTGQTRRAVHDAVRTLRQDEDTELSIPLVAAAAGVHPTTIYRRWRTIEILLLDVAVEDLNAMAPVQATGHLERDLRSFIRPFLARARNDTPFFGLLVSTRQALARDGVSLADLVAPRVAQFQAMLDAAGVTRIDGMRLVELVVMPAYVWAQMGRPLDPDRDTDRLVDAVLRETRG